MTEPSPKRLASTVDIGNARFVVPPEWANDRMSDNIIQLFALEAKVHAVQAQAREQKTRFAAALKKNGIAPPRV